MKHTRVPRTVRSDIWRLAIEISSIPSLYIFEAESEIISKVESKTVNKPNEPNRKSNRLKKKKFHVPWATLNYYLGRLMWCNVCVFYAVNRLSKTTLPAVEFNLPYAIADPASLPCANFVPTSISPALYGMLYSVVMLLQQRTTGTHNPKDQGVDSPRNIRCL